MPATGRTRNGSLFLEMSLKPWHMKNRSNRILGGGAMRAMEGCIIALVFISVTSRNVFAQVNEVALTPPMGWNTYNCFGGRINEAKIISIADAMVKSGMKKAGYQYIIIDDGWMTGKRDRYGHIIVDSVKFPHGIKAVADYVHSLGLKFGIYSSPGRYTCMKLMGSLGHEQEDADDYAAWGVDFLKYDWCRYPDGTVKGATATPRDACRAAFELMYRCLERTGHPMVYSTGDQCSTFNGKHSQKGALPWIKTIANMHRTGRDIRNNWDLMMYCLETAAELWQYAGPGYWNDPDMLEVGNEHHRYKNQPGMNLTEYRTHFSMWCMVEAPLIAGNDLRNMSPDIVKILTNKEVIALDQDPLGKQGRRIRDNGGREVWIKELSGNRMAVALLNKGEDPVSMEFSWDEIGISGKMKVRDLWRHKNLGKYKGSFRSEKIAGHGVTVLLLEHEKKHFLAL
jgi:alpha-galactosidase